jgi:IS30 family transposase
MKKGIPRLTFEERKKLEQLNKQRLTLEAMASELQRSTNTIKVEFRRGGGRNNYSAEVGQNQLLINTQRQYCSGQRPLSSEQLQTLEKGIQDNLSLHELRRKVGCSYNKLKDLLEKMGISYDKRDFAGFMERFESLEMRVDLILEILQEIKNVPNNP